MNSIKDVRGQNILFSFLNTSFKSILLISRTKFSRRIRHCSIAKVSLSSYKKVNEVVFGKLSVFLALVKSKLAFGGT